MKDEVEVIIIYFKYFKHFVQNGTFTTIIIIISNFIIIINC